MNVIGPERTTIEVCPSCGLDVRDGDHATSSHQLDEPVEVEYVRADQLRGAVSALQAARGVMRARMADDDRLDAPFDEDMAEALRRIDAALGGQ